MDIDTKGNFKLEMDMNQMVEFLLDYCQEQGLESHLSVSLAREYPDAYQICFSAPPQIDRAVRFQKRNPYQVYVCHAYEDAKLAQQLARDLKNEGKPTWLVPNNILPGEKWETATRRGLHESGVFLLLMTTAIAKSKWARSEIEAALELAQEGFLRIILLHVEKVTVPKAWQKYEQLPFWDSDEARWEEFI
jgi:hypothetical protein